jgi:hypothetical protein
MVFGLEQIGKFFDALYRGWISYNVVVTIVIAFLIFVALNVLLIMGYMKVITAIPLIVNKIKEILAKIEAWVG